MPDSPRTADTVSSGNGEPSGKSTPAPFHSRSERSALWGIKFTPTGSHRKTNRRKYAGIASFTFVEHMLNGARRGLRPRDHSRAAPSPAWMTPGVRRLIRSFVRQGADPKSVDEQYFRDVTEGRLRWPDEVVPGGAVVGSGSVLSVNA
jgi:hypothetical protein